MIYDDVLQSAIFNNSTIIALLSLDADSHPMLIGDLVCPEDWGKEATSINYYGDSYIDDGYGEEIFTVNCRAKSYIRSLTLAQTIRDELHRHNTSTGDGLFVCEIQRTLPPYDLTDNYNTIMSVKLTTRAIR